LIEKTCDEVVLQTNDPDNPRTFDPEYVAESADAVWTGEVADPPQYTTIPVWHTAASNRLVRTTTMNKTVPIAHVYGSQKSNQPGFFCAEVQLSTSGMFSYLRDVY
jgi:hypothetical protein